MYWVIILDFFLAFSCPALVGLYLVLPFCLDLLSFWKTLLKLKLLKVPLHLRTALAESSDAGSVPVPGVTLKGAY